MNIATQSFAPSFDARQSRMNRRAGILLLALVASFVTLVPGGPIETRDFSHLGGTVFWGFNAFLISLCLAGVVSAIGLFRDATWAPWTAIGVAWCYIFVVLLDLGHVFPVSPDPIPLALGLVEIFDAILAGYVLVLTHRSLDHF